MGELIQYLLDGATVPERHHTLYQYDGLDKLDMKHDRYTGNWKGVIKGTEYTAEKDLTLPYDVILKMVSLSKQVIRLPKALLMPLPLSSTKAQILSLSRNL